MAKNKFDFDDDLDFDLDKELGGIDFGESDSKPPKNKREAVQRTMKSVGRGFRDEILSNKLKTAGKLAKNSIPRSLSAEFSDVAGVASDVKNIVSESVDEVKKQSAGLSRALGKLLPENSKLAKLLSKVSDKLDDHVEQSQQESKEQKESNEIQQGILAALGELKDKSHTDALLQQTMQNKQFASNIEMLKNIYAETKLQRLFTYEITNSYYRKSLELQYKQLFTQREILELQKLMYTSQKNQLESLVLNTALPDYLKARGQEALKYTISQKARDLVASNLFKSGSAFSRMGDNIRKRAQGFMSGLKEGLGGAKDMTEMMVDMRDMYRDMGMNPGEMAGSSIANFLNQYLGGKIAKKIEATKWGKEGIFKMKEAYADPRKFLESIANQKDAKGAKKVFAKAARFLKGFTSNPTKLEAEYQQRDLDESAMFDNRAHQSITKVIPGLLSKIYAETKMTRLGLKIKGDSSAHELAFDNKDDMFKTKKQLVGTINREIRQSLNTDFKGFATRLQYALADAGCGLSGSEASSLNRALLNYSMQPGSSVAAGTLWDPDFLRFVQDPKLAEKLAKNGPKLRAYLVANPYEQENISSLLQSMKSSLPNLSKRFQDLQKDGHSNLLVAMKVAKRTRSGNLRANQRGVDAQIFRNYSDALGRVDIPEWMIGRSSSILGQRVGGKIDSTLNGIANTISNITADDVISGGINAAHKAAGYARQGMNTVDGLVQQAMGTQAYKQAAQHAANLKAKFDNSRAGKLSNALFKAGQRNANKLKDKVANSKFVRSVMTSNSAQKITEMFVEKKRKAEEFLNLPPEQQTAQAVKAFRDTQQAAREFINATKTAVTGDTDFKSLEHDIKEGMADIASMAKKVWNGEATSEDVQNFKNAMKIRAKSLGQTGKSLGKRGYAAGGKLYTKTRLKAAEVKSLIQSNVNGFLQTDKGQQVLEKFRQAKAKYGTIHDKVGNKLGPVRTAVKNALGKAVNATQQEVDNLIEELDRVDRGEATTGSSKVLSTYDKVMSTMGTARDTISDPRKAMEAAKKGYDKLKKLFEKPVEREEALKMHGKYIAAMKKEGLQDSEILTDFMEWCKAFHIKIKGEGPFGGGIRGFFQWTRQKDREIWTKFMGGAIKAPFQFVGGMLSNTRIGNTIGKIPGLGKLTGLSGGGSLAAGSGNLAAKAGGLAMSAGIGLGKAATDMLPAPMRVLVQAPFMAIGTMATGMGEILKFMGIRTKQEDKEKKKQEKLNKKKEKMEKEKSSSDGWMSRLKQWGSRKKEQGKGLLNSAKTWFQEKKTPLTVLGGILGIFALTKALGITAADMADGIKKVASTAVDIGKKVVDFGKGIYDFFGGGFSGIMALLATGFGIKKLGGFLIGKMFKGAGKLALGLGKGALSLGMGVGSAVFNKLTGKTPTPKVSIDSKGRARTPDGKFAKATPSKGKVPKINLAEGRNLWNKIPKPIQWFLGDKDKWIERLSKLSNSWKGFVGKMKWLKDTVTKPKVLAKVGTKAAGKLSAYVLSAASGIGVVLTLGFAVWDTAWILKYMFLDGMSFGSALSTQMLGIDLFDSKVQKELELSDEEREQKLQETLNKEEEKKDQGILHSLKTGVSAVASKVDTAISMIPGVGSVYQGVKSGVKSVGQALGIVSKPTVDPNFKGNPKAAQAADLVTASAGEKSKGLCATYVNNGLRKAGIPIAGGDGWKADDNLTKLGWQRVWDGADGSNFSDFKPQKGDVLSMGRLTGEKATYNGKTAPEVLPEGTGAKGGRIYGHTAIFNGSQWVSDFKQNNPSPYSNKALSYKYSSVLRMPTDPSQATEQGGDVSAYDRAKYSNRARSSIASRTSTSGNTRSVVNIDTSSVTDVLRASYQVHVESRDILREIRDAVKASQQTTAQAVQAQAANNVMPSSAIGLQHNNYNFG